MIVREVRPPPSTPYAKQRLAALTPLDAAALDALDDALAKPTTVRQRRDIVSRQAEIPGPRIIVSGWAARARTLADGRRQFLSLFLPGDLIGFCRQPRPLAVFSVVALTDVTLCPAPAPATSPALARAYAMGAALDEAYQLEQIARLGRLNAQERIYSLLLELNERLALAGLASGGMFELPLTQEIVADTLGLTSVHINRMLQIARRAGDVVWRGGHVHLRDPAATARLIGWSPPRVSAA